MTALICLVAIAGLFDTDDSASYRRHLAGLIPERLAVCSEVVHAAESRGLDVAVAVSVAFEESRFRPNAVSDAGAVGPLQVLPQYHCPADYPCDPTEAGVEVLIEYLRRHGDLETAAAHYNGGNHPGPRSRSYAWRVVRLTERLRAVRDAARAWGLGP